MDELRRDVPMIFEPAPLLFGRELEGGRGERDGPRQRAPAEPLRLRRLAHEDVRVREAPSAAQQLERVQSDEYVENV